MKIVNTITRITLINNALDRLPYDEKYDDIWERLVDKRMTLRNELDNWMHDKEVSASVRIQRRHAVMRRGYC